MKYLCIVYLNAERWNACSDAVCFEHVQALVADHCLLAGEALHCTYTATTVRVRNGEVTLFDGPSADTHEMLAGFYLVEVKNLNEAIRLAAGIPSAKYGSIEVRPVRERQVAVSH